MNAFVFVNPVPKYAAKVPKTNFVCPISWEEERYYLIDNLKYKSDNKIDCFHSNS